MQCQQTCVHNSMKTEWSVLWNSWWPHHCTRQTCKNVYGVLTWSSTETHWVWDITFFSFNTLSKIYNGTSVEDNGGVVAGIYILINNSKIVSNYRTLCSEFSLGHKHVSFLVANTVVSLKLYIFNSHVLWVYTKFTARTQVHVGIGRLHSFVLFAAQTHNTMTHSPTRILYLRISYIPSVANRSRYLYCTAHMLHHLDCTDRLPDLWRNG